MIKQLLQNWKTTSAGLVMIVGSVIHLVFAVRAGNATEGVWTASLTAILAGIGLIFAGDSAQSAKQVQDAKQEIQTAFLNKPEAKPITGIPNPP